MDLQTLVFSILSGGLLSIFLLGFLTQRVHSRAALIATIVTVAAVCFWLLADSATGTRLMPGLKQVLPDKFWIVVFSNIFLFGLAYLLSRFLRPRDSKNLQNLTVWTLSLIHI